MNFQVRKQKILFEINKNKIIDVKTFAKEVRISEITIRRDLNKLAKEGHLVRTHGGAINVVLASLPISFAQKVAINTEAKEEICLKAAALINENDVVFLDCGSTVFSICKYIKNKKIKVVTNSIPILNELLNSAVTINFVGGEIDFDRQATHGKIAIEHIKRYNYNLAFIGVDGISTTNGLSASSEKEAETTQALISQNIKIYFLCDHSKLETTRYLPFEPINVVKNLIVDSKSPKAILNNFKSLNISIL
jgi:DeoR family transcriptional regulator, fructose operon transcriptional repressor